MKLENCLLKSWLIFINGRTVLSVSCWKATWWVRTRLRLIFTCGSNKIAYESRARECTYHSTGLTGKIWFAAVIPVGYFHSEMPLRCCLLPGIPHRAGSNKFWDVVEDGKQILHPNFNSLFTLHIVSLFWQQAESCYFYIFVWVNILKKCKKATKTQAHTNMCFMCLYIYAHRYI